MPLLPVRFSSGNCHWSIDYRATGDLNDADTSKIWSVGTDGTYLFVQGTENREVAHASRGDFVKVYSVAADGTTTETHHEKIPLRGSGTLLDWDRHFGMIVDTGYVHISGGGFLCSHINDGDGTLTTGTTILHSSTNNQDYFMGEILHGKYITFGEGEASGSRWFHVTGDATTAMAAGSKISSTIHSAWRSPPGFDNNFYGHDGNGNTNKIQHFEVDATTGAITNKAQYAMQSTATRVHLTLMYNNTRLYYQGSGSGTPEGYFPVNADGTLGTQVTTDYPVHKTLIADYPTGLNKKVTVNGWTYEATGAVLCQLPN